MNQAAKAATGEAEPAGRRPVGGVRLAGVVLAVVVPIQIFGVLLVRRMTYTVYSVDFTEGYRPAAESILRGEGPKLPDGRVLMNYPPGYPFYTAGLILINRGTGLPLIALIVAGNIAWNALTVLALFFLGYRVGGRRLAVTSGLLAGLYPPVLYLSKIAFVQVPYLTFLAWGLYAAYVGHVRRHLGFFALAGAMFGFAALLRPAGLAMLAMLIAYLLVFFQGPLRRRLCRPAMTLGMFLVIFLPWTLYYTQHRRVVVLANVARSHLEGTAEAQSASDDPRKIRGAKHFGELARAPLRHSVEILRRALKSWYHTDSGRYERASLVINLPFALLLALGLAPALGAPSRWGAGLVLSAFLAAWGLSTLTIYLARYVATGVVLAAPVLATGLLWAGDRLGITHKT